MALKKQHSTTFLIFYFVLILCGCSNIPTKERNSSFSSTIKISNEISNQSINCIVQDKEGYIWLGTERGLNKYNSYYYYHFLHLTNDSNTISNNHVNTLFFDKKDNLWIGTQNGICRLDHLTQKISTIPVKSNQVFVQQFSMTSDGTIYANLIDGIYKYDAKNNIFTLALKFDISYTLNSFFIDSNDRFWLISRNTIKCYSKDNFDIIREVSIDTSPNLFYGYLLENGELWALHDKGQIHIFNTLTNTVIPIPDVIKMHPVLSKAIVTNVFYYKENQYLISTYNNGIFLYDKGLNKLISQKNSQFPLTIPNVTINTIFKDRSNNIWIGTQEQGVHTYYHAKNNFNINRHLQNLTSNKSVKGLYLDKKNRLWISTINDDLFIYDLKTNQYNKIDLNYFFPEDPYYQDKIINISADDQHIWFMTDTKILCCTYDGKTLKRKETYDFKKQLYQFILDDYGKIWVSTDEDNIFIIDIDKKEYQSKLIFNPGIGYKSAVLKLSDGNILFAASNQIPMIVNPVTFESKEFNPGNYFGINKISPTSLYEDQNGNIWIGDYNGSLLRYDKTLNQIKKVNLQNVTSIVEDSEHNFWTGTLFGLGKYIIKEDRSSLYYSYDGIGGNQFNENVCMLPDSSLAFAGTHGLTVFKPSQITFTEKFPLYFEDFKINNESYQKFNSLLSGIKSSNNNVIKLNHNQNTISISFAALDYSVYSRTRYDYQLLNYDNDWINAGNNKTAHYANLKPGEYIFKVKATSNDNLFIKGENTLKIKITPPIWLRWYAILFYTIVVSLTTWLFLFLYIRAEKSKDNAQIAIREKEHEAYINNMNMSFFSNISHEFRTPLTIISAPITTLYKSLKVPPEEKKLLELIQRSIKRMLRLVNQLMDLSKLEADTLRLRVSRMDIVHQIQSILELYVIYGKEKDIKVNINGLKESFFMLVDLDKIEKILGNLLSNALKFTSQNGEISYNLELIENETAADIFPQVNKSKYQGAYALFEIEDNGSGIPEDKLENIFIRYYQIDNNKNASFNWGTGIGLYYTRKLIELHHGFIKAGNATSGGAKFQFIIPVEDVAYSTNELSTFVSDEEKKSELTASKASQDVLYTDTQAKKHADSTKDKILIVDDDIEVSYYLRTLFGKDYNVINKYDGEQAYLSLEEIDPVLIISDVLMPGLNGYELCKKVKENISYCHIPVILLTAKSLLEEKVEGLETGANAYVTKPFESEYLQALVKSQIKNKKLLSNLLTNNTNTNNVKKDILLPKDKVFMDKLYELIEKELDNPEMNVSSIAEKLGMSRTKFYQKIKGLTNENPNTFIKKYKLNRAAEFIKAGEHNISEIAYMTGFVNLSHFSVSFKKQFGNSPSEYKG